VLPVLLCISLLQLPTLQLPNMQLPTLPNVDLSPDAILSLLNHAGLKPVHNVTLPVSCTLHAPGAFSTASADVSSWKYLLALA
jgi:hypothetical protein